MRIHLSGSQLAKLVLAVENEEVELDDLKKSDVRIISFITKKCLKLIKRLEGL
jgi:hypothetical protein